MKGELLDAVKKGVADPGQAPTIHGLMHQQAADVVTAIQADERFAISVAYSDEELGAEQRLWRRSLLRSSERQHGEASTVPRTPGRCGPVSSVDLQTAST